MDRENGHPVSKAHIEPFGGGSAYRHFRFFVMLGLIYGIIVASVLYTSPAAITVVTYALPVFAVVGIVAGAWYGFFFIADVKPKGGKGGEIVEDFRQFLDDYARLVTEEAGDRRSNKSRHPHPWFGNLNAHQWVCLGAVHQSIHRRQMERTVAGLERAA